MTEQEAIRLLAACRPLIERITATYPSGMPINCPLTPQDLVAIQGAVQVQTASVSAGPGLLRKLEQAAELSQVDIYKLEQLQRIVYKRTYVLVSEDVLPKLKQQNNSKAV